MIAGTNSLHLYIGKVEPLDFSVTEPISEKYPFPCRHPLGGVKCSKLFRTERYVRCKKPAMSERLVVFSLHPYSVAHLLLT